MPAPLVCWSSSSALGASKGRCVVIQIVCGDPGSGKSLRVLKWMEQAAYSGRIIYTNIALTQACPFHSVVRLLDSPGWPICRLKSQGPDRLSGYQFFWEFIEDDALVVIDEGDIHFGALHWQDFGDNAFIYHKQHRKWGHDVVYLCQNATRIWKTIRMLAGRFILAEHTFKTTRELGWVASLFGRDTALSLSRFLYAEFADETFRRIRGGGHMTYSEAQRYFPWYDTEQLLGDTETLVKRKKKGLNNDFVRSDSKAT